MAARVGNYLKAMRSVALGRAPAGRNLTVFPDDIFLVSYVRSGSTWARFLLGNLIHESTGVNFVNVNRMLPSIYDFPDRVLRSLPRVMKSHECFDPRYRRVIHIVRDPRDVAVSFYHYNLKVRVLSDGFSLDEFVQRFIAAQTAPYVDRWGSWEDHTASWLRMRQGRSDYLLVRYEDLLANPQIELGKISSAFNMNATSERIEHAITLSSAKNMRSLEKEQWKQWNTTKETREDIPFVREAKAGGWRKQLSAASVARIERAWGPLMDQLGYELTSAPSQRGFEKPYAFG